MVIKLFNITSEKTINMLSDRNIDIYNLPLKFYDGFMEVKIVISDEESLLKDGTIAEITSVLKDYIYSFEDKNIYEVLASYLSVRNKTISFAELGSFGRLATKLMESDDMENHVLDSITLNSIEGMVKNFDIDEKNLKKDVRVSSLNAYTIASYLRQHSLSDIVVCNMAVLNMDNSEDINVLQQKGLSYISIGDSESLSTKKFNFCGTREEIIEGVSKMTCFLLINKLK